MLFIYLFVHLFCLQELYYGGWVAPNIYYLGSSGVVRYGGLTIAGISGQSVDWWHEKNRHVYTNTKQMYSYTYKTDILIPNRQIHTNTTCLFAQAYSNRMTTARVSSSALHTIEVLCAGGA